MSFGDLIDRAGESSPDEITARLREIEASERQLAAEKSALMVAAEALDVPKADGHASTHGWLIANTNCSKATARRARQVARVLAHVAEIGDAFAAGRIGVSQVVEFGHAFARQPGGNRLAEFAAELVESAEHLEFDDFRTELKRWELEVDPDGVADEIAESIERRSAEVAEVPGGISVEASGGDPIAAVEMASIFQRYVEAEFRLDAGEAARADAESFPRSAAQRRFDALLAIFRDAAVSRSDGPARDVVVNLVVSDDHFTAALARHRFLEMLDVVPRLPLRQQRCETSTGTVIPEDAVLVAALSGRVRQVITDTNGRVVQLGRTQRLFNAAQREAATLLSTSCSWNGCHVPAELCQIDHLAEWHRDLGVTDIENAAVQCRGHNLFKTRNGIRSRPTALGSIEHRRSDGTPIRPVGAASPPMPRPDPWEEACCDLANAQECSVEPIDADQAVSDDEVRAALERAVGRRSR